MIKQTQNGMVCLSALEGEPGDGYMVPIDAETLALLEERRGLYSNFYDHWTGGSGYGPVNAMCLVRPLSELPTLLRGEKHRPLVEIQREVIELEAVWFFEEREDESEGEGRPIELNQE